MNTRCNIHSVIYLFYKKNYKLQRGIKIGKHIPIVESFKKQIDLKTVNALELLNLYSKF